MRKRFPLRSSCENSKNDQWSWLKLKLDAAINTKKVLLGGTPEMRWNWFQMIKIEFLECGLFDGANKILLQRNGLSHPISGPVGIKFATLKYLIKRSKMISYWRGSAGVNFIRNEYLIFQTLHFYRSDFSKMAKILLQHNFFLVFFMRLQS